MAETGGLSVLNVGAGDIEINFNHHDRGEAKKAIAMLTDMQQRGYAILVRDPVDGSYARATRIDATRGKYILSLPEGQEPKADETVVTCRCGCGKVPLEGKAWAKGHQIRKPHSLKKAVQIAAPIKNRRATGIARSAGG